MGNLQRTSYRFSFVDVSFQVDVLFDVVRSAMGDRKVPRTEEAGAALHMLGARHWSYNAQKLFCITLFPDILVCVFFFGGGRWWGGGGGTRFITQELAFSFSLLYGDLKWLKTEVVSPGSDTEEQELNQTLRLVSWLKRKRWLAMAQLTSQT